MSGQGSKNISASIRARLLNVSRPTGEDFNLTLVRYAVERFLYRLSQSRYAANFILKGAMLFTVWTSESHRPTQDLDLLGIGDLSDENLQAMLNDIINTNVAEDGLEFADVIEQLSRFLSPPLQATANNKKFTLCWEPGGPWSKADK